MKNLLLLLLAILIAPFNAISQNCNCESNFDWLKNTFENNDAGYTYAIETKGAQAYKNHTYAILNKITEVEDQETCATIMNEWLSFFRSGHIGLEMLNQKDSRNKTELSKEEIIKKYSTSPKVDIQLTDFETYLKSKSQLDFEGIWVSDPYKIGIKKIDDRYVGFIIEADGVYWREGQIKFTIEADNSFVYYMQDHSKQTFSTTELWEANYIQSGFVNFERLHPKKTNSPEIERYSKAMVSNETFFEVLDEKTAYLRIPSFNSRFKTHIDSVIATNFETITNTENLIIDIRNNGGGSDRCYSNLMPILYTNPIRIVGLEFYSTPLNNQRMKDLTNLKEANFSDEEIKFFNDAYDKLSNNLETWVNLDSTDVELETYDKIYTYPQNIGILIHENNGSTAEQFLLAAKQSKKVKLFGHTTAGVLDISNVHAVNSPCNEYQLGYSLSRSKRIPHMAIDGKGIQPDYYIDDSILKYKWIEFVSEVLKY